MKSTIKKHLENMTKNDCEKNIKKQHFCPKLNQNASQNQSRRAPEASCEQLGAWSLQKWPKSHPRSAAGAIFHRKINLAIVEREAREAKEPQALQATQPQREQQEGQEQERQH